jgi:hypothetical protein
MQKQQKSKEGVEKPQTYDESLKLVLQETLQNLMKAGKWADAAKKIQLTVPRGYQDLIGTTRADDLTVLFALEYHKQQPKKIQSWNVLCLEALANIEISPSDTTLTSRYRSFTADKDALEVARMEMFERNGITEIKWNQI